MDPFDQVARGAIDDTIAALKSAVLPQKPWWCQRGLWDGLATAAATMQRGPTYEVLAIRIRARFPAVYAALARHDARVTELLQANTDLVLAHRDRAEQLAKALARAEQAEAELAQYKGNPT